MKPIEQQLGPISPFFIVEDVARSVEFYVGTLGFELRLELPEVDPFFAIVGSGGAQIHIKCVGQEVKAQPNPTRHRDAPWDAFIYVENPDALTVEFATRPVQFHEPLGDREDGLRGFEVRDPDGYVLYFGRPIS